jgi:leucyl/phenylalanyl-tRNA--protein transferase
VTTSGEPQPLPREPEPTRWAFPPPESFGPDDLVCVGGDLTPGTLLAAYRTGLFPMPAGRKRLGWWSPDPRGILPLDAMHVSRSLRKSCRKFEIRCNTDFRTVMSRCGDPRRPHGWINDEFIDAYDRLHRLGWVHTVETWRDGRLVGGLYGVAIGGLFAGESMFHEDTDASKVALVALVDRLNEGGFSLLDVQWKTDHLASLGVVNEPRFSYLKKLRTSLTKHCVFPA